jgi:PIN domain nuclease of toxin-antitoxin system
MPQILLDTHILVWWQFDSARLSRAQIQMLLDVEKRGQRSFLSAISLREIANLTATGRLEIPIATDTWLEEIESDLVVLPITAKIAAESVRLGDGFPQDPADQIIAATARSHGLTLMTADEHIRRWGRVPVV